MQSSQQLLPYNEKKMRCKLSIAEGKSAEEKFVFWHSKVTQFFEHSYDATRILASLKPETSPVEHDKVKVPFISNLTIISRNEANISIWNGPVHTWDADLMHIDSEGKLNGKCYFTLKATYFNQTGMHDLLQWKLRGFFGNFQHGVLNGFALLFTWRGTYIYANFKEGVLHGPIFEYGTHPILDMEVIRTA